MNATLTYLLILRFLTLGGDAIVAEQPEFEALPPASACVDRSGIALPHEQREREGDFETERGVGREALGDRVDR